MTMEVDEKPDIEALGVMEPSSSQPEFPPGMAPKMLKLVKVLNELETKLNPVTSKSHHQLMAKMTPVEKANVGLMEVYTINSLYWVLMRTKGEDVDATLREDYKLEMGRLKETQIRLAELEARPRRSRIDTEAAGRFIRHGLGIRRNEQTGDYEYENPQTRNSSIKKRLGERDEEYGEEEEEYGEEEGEYGEEEGYGGEEEGEYGGEEEGAYGGEEEEEYGEEEEEYTEDVMELAGDKYAYGSSQYGQQMQTKKLPALEDSSSEESTTEEEEESSSEDEEDTPQKAKTNIKKNKKMNKIKKQSQCTEVNTDNSGYQASGEDSYLATPKMKSNKLESRLNIDNGCSIDDPKSPIKKKKKDVNENIPKKKKKKIEADGDVQLKKKKKGQDDVQPKKKKIKTNINSDVHSHESGEKQESKLKKNKKKTKNSDAFINGVHNIVKDDAEGPSKPPKKKQKKKKSAEDKSTDDIKSSLASDISAFLDTTRSLINYQIETKTEKPVKKGRDWYEGGWT